MATTNFYNQQESYNTLRLAFHDEDPSLSTLYNWFILLKRGPTNLTDDLRRGHLSMVTTEDNISAVRPMIETDKRVTYQQLRISLGVEILAHQPYSPDLTSCHFYLFPKIKEQLLGKWFTDAEEIVPAHEKSMEATP
ncbi:hypothetical protein EVAR_11832_1 [Eumeta japonica]|uniref:Histone-lysine N-methyltransferase SETMAR n=1 Tax=Eumeta variegata TaxID=151549 RepID=A0A4C1YQU9_EUMVA|nr:hypothetical protein EVAR_11832_1 [Eumeta japonica]